MTLREKFVTNIVKDGGVEVKETPKYIVFTHPMFPHFLYVGKSGALRHGKTVTDSIPLSVRGRNHFGK